MVVGLEGWRKSNKVANDENAVNITHTEAVNALKGAGTRVTLVSQ